MNDNYGKVFRVIRISQNLTLKEVSQGVVSLSYLSKFETGKTNITLSIFLKLLDKINVKIDEFIFFCNNSFYHFNELASQISTAYRETNTSKLCQLQETEKKLFLATRKKSHQINSIMIAAAIIDLNPSHSIPKKDLKIMSDYLLQIPFWTSYNLFILSNSHAIISPYLLITLIQEIRRLDANKSVEYSCPSELILLLHHAAITFLRIDEIEQAILAYKYAKKLLKSGFLFEKNRSLFIKGLIIITQGKTYEGITLATKAISVLETLEVPLVNRYVIELKKTIEKVKH
ncbi:helix-turn-helix domain-containing protein [Vagococcus sp. BWB3-3]|uniref:Helix-turn-helix domain-containing protein n=1 Tax=Vagococcus allomyrinae TaxID=2794353 RepID=A0A940P9X7_9ENTE|nr:Rgg/GadR/MutR family transcriptional regulator [Vagococcus allomyrinae]MBP1040173.1 helix-turn-helix domain-containing protein [Vagococcus allomyrinae]